MKYKQYLNKFIHLYKRIVGNTVDKCHKACASRTQNNGGKSLTSNSKEIATST